MYKIGKRMLWDSWDREYLGERVLYKDDDGYLYYKNKRGKRIYLGNRLKVVYSPEIGGQKLP